MKFSIFLLIIVVVFQAGCTKQPVLNEIEKVSIISISPSSAYAGSIVVIKGANFELNKSDNIVRFNNDSATVLSSSADSLIVIAPLNGSSGPVTVSVAGVVATGPVFTYIIDSVDVYVSAPAMGVVYWKNGQGVFLEPTQLNIGGAYGIAVSDTNVYLGSYTFSDIYPGKKAAYWKNGQKTLLSLPNSPGEVRALVLSGSNLYTGGSEDQKPVYWKNTVKYSLPFTGRGYSRVNALAVNGNNIYAVGLDIGTNGEYLSVYWKDSIETVLGKASGIDQGATSIALNGNDVYICGNEFNDAVYWKNGEKVILQKFSSDSSASAKAIAIEENNIYVVGSYRGDAVYWKNGIRFILPSGGQTWAIASAITFYKSDIYIGGRIGDRVVYWKNGVEVPLCCSQYASVSAIVVVKKP
jgi:hypothetical protein